MKYDLFYRSGKVHVGLTGDILTEEEIATTMGEKGADPDFGSVLKNYPQQSMKQAIAKVIR